MGHEDAHENGLDSHILVSLLGGKIGGVLQRLVGVTTQVGVAAVHLGQAVQFVLQWALDHSLGDVELLENELHHRVALSQNGLQKVHGLKRLVVIPLGDLNGLLNNFLCFDSVVVECHDFFLFLCLHRILSVHERSNKHASRH